MAGHYTLFDWVSLDAGSWAEWFSGIMSFAAVLAALGGYWLVHHQRRLDARKAEILAAESVAWKLILSFNHTAEIAKHLKQGLSRHIAPSTKDFIFPRVQPLGVPNRIIPDLTQEEVSFLLKAKASDVLMELSDAISRYDSIMLAMNEYKSRHEALYHAMPPPVTMNGSRFMHQLTPEENALVAPLARMLDELLRSIVDLVADGIERSAEALDAYPIVMRKHFGKWQIAMEGNRNEVDLTIFRSQPLSREN